MKNTFIYLSMLLLPMSLLAQQPVTLDNWCGTAQRMNAMQQNPQQAQSLLDDDAIRQQEALATPNVPKGTIYTIPVVFHILHNNGPENTTEEQIFNALDVINRDFRLQNPDTADVIPLFKPIMGDVEIEFALATKAPNGDCFRGYTRTESPLTSQGDDGGAQVDAIRNGNDVYQGNWPSNKYLNVFVVDHAGGAGGYTNYPNNWGGTDMSNGIWILHTQFGEIGTSSPSGGRSLTHECGHWLNLRHTWGNSNNPGLASNCSEDDLVNDTPLCMGSSGGCPLGENSCGPIANVQNYMDYALSCQSMFTLGQVDRMRAAIISSVGGRNNLWTQQNLDDTGADGVMYLCDADFTVNKTAICAGESVDFSDISFNEVNGWDWTFTGGSPANSTVQNPTVTYNTPGLYEVVLSATDGSNTDVETKTAYIRVLPAPSQLPFLETFESFTTLSNITEWEVNNEQGNEFELETTTGHTGTQCARLMNNGQSTGTLDELVAMPVDLSSVSEVTLSFRYAYKRKNSTDDDWFRVYVTNDCGDNWVVRKTLHGFQLSSQTQSSSYTPSSQEEWTTIHMTNITSAYWVNNFRYKFSFESGGGNNFYIDNINIYAGSPSDDLVVGLDEETGLSGVNIYPNPVEDELSVAFSVNNAQQSTLKIQDLSGKVMQQHTLNANAGSNMAFIDTKELAQGMYFLTIQTGNAERTVQFVVK